MALVAYDNSDSSEYEDDETTTVGTLVQNKTAEPSVSEPVKQVQEELSDQSQSLFNHLPQPSSKKPSVLEEDDEFLHKKETDSNAAKPKAKITVPSLSDFRDVEDSIPVARPKKVNGKKSGLLSILPQPKNGITLTAKSTTTSMIPHVLTQKPKPTTTVKKKEPLPSPAKKVKSNKLLAVDYSDESDTEEVQNDFFSINKPVPELPADDQPLDIDEKVISNRNITRHVADPSMQRQTGNIDSYFKSQTGEGHAELEPGLSASGNAEYNEAGSSYGEGYVQVAEGVSNGEVALDEEAILKLCGTRGKRKREDIQIVDVNQQEVLADAREWLLKGLMDDTSKRVSASKRKGNEPTSQQRRKHQITYLAHQAKANEVELQNQWANNRQSKRQTQSKYGF